MNSKRCDSTREGIVHLGIFRSKVRRGRIGRSLGCPAVRPAIAHRLIDSMKDGQLLFSYYPDQRWLKSSSYINCGSGTVASSEQATKRQ